MPVTLPLHVRVERVDRGAEPRSAKPVMPGTGPRDIARAAKPTGAKRVNRVGGGRSRYDGHRDPKHTVHYTRVAAGRFEGLWR